MAHTDRLALAFETQALALPPAGRIVVLRAAPSRFLGLVPRDRLSCIQTFRPSFDALRRAGCPVATEAEGPAALVVVQLTRSRRENLGNAALGLGLLEPGGTLVVAGAKTEGIDSIVRLIGAELPVADSYVKAHGRVFWLERPAALPPAVAGWAAAAAPSCNADGFVTAPGTFSADRVDPGSRRLAETFAGRLKGRVADLGAGWGWLAHTALARCPEITALDLFEAEARALDAARVNVVDPRAAFHWSDVATLETGAARYDWVIANPPFHQSRAAEPDLGAAFIATAARILKREGRLLLVANRQLPYEAPLAAAFRHSASLGEDPLYKILCAERPLDHPRPRPQIDAGPRVRAPRRPAPALRGSR